MADYFCSILCFGVFSRLCCYFEIMRFSLSSLKSFSPEKSQICHLLRPPFIVLSPAIQRTTTVHPHSDKNTGFVADVSFEKSNSGFTFFSQKEGIFGLPPVITRRLILRLSPVSPTLVIIPWQVASLTHGMGAISAETQMAIIARKHDSRFIF